MSNGHSYDSEPCIYCGTPTKGTGSGDRAVCGGDTCEILDKAEGE